MFGLAFCEKRVEKVEKKIRACLLTFVSTRIILLLLQKKGGGLDMSPRTGRPTDDKKELRLQLRVSVGNVKKLEYAAEVLGLTKAEIIRRGIELMYEKAQREAKK